VKAHLGQHTWLRIKRALSHLWGPRVVGGWVRGDGQYLAHTRISNQCSIFEPQKLQVDDHVFIGHFCILDASNGLSIGEGCQFAAYSSAFTHSSHVAIRLYGREYVHTTAKKAYFEASIALAPYCFIGVHSTLQPGTRLGKGCLVAAYSRVHGSFEDFSVIAGNPAKRIGDTREMDAAHLQRHPELKAHYEQWAGAIGTNSHRSGVD
jgi:acetyltransferase-like isoleucine patch superfamily enzyme